MQLLDGIVKQVLKWVRDRACRIWAWFSDMCHLSSRILYELNVEHTGDYHSFLKNSDVDGEIQERILGGFRLFEQHHDETMCRKIRWNALVNFEPSRVYVLRVERSENHWLKELFVLKHYEKSTKCLIYKSSCRSCTHELFIAPRIHTVTSPLPFIDITYIKKWSNW